MFRFYFATFFIFFKVVKEDAVIDNFNESGFETTEKECKKIANWSKRKHRRQLQSSVHQRLRAFVRGVIGFSITFYLHAVDPRSVSFTVSLILLGE